jgi:hypothetical protein
VKLDYVRYEIARMRPQILAREHEIEMLRRAGTATAAAELLLTRTRAKLEYLSNARYSGRRPTRAGCPGLFPGGSFHALPLPRRSIGQNPATHSAPLPQRLARLVSVFFEGGMIRSLPLFAI